MKPEYRCTVIIPYYNTDEKIFARCMDSLLTVDSSVLVLIVDDGSDEEHKAIPEKYAGENVRIIRKANGGVSSARNTALEKAEGKYILFLDSDDRAREGFPLKLCDSADSFGAQVLISSITIMPRGETEITHFPKNTVSDGKTLVLENPDLFKSFDLCYSVRMCFDRELIMKNNIRFREDMTISEDMVFNIEALLSAERCAAICDSFYEYYLDTENSATRAKFMRGYSQSLEIQYGVCRKLCRGSQKLEKLLAEFYMDFAFYNLVRNQKAGGLLTYDEYKKLCEMPMFRESIELLGEGHKCENRKAEALYKMRFNRRYLLPYVSAAK